MQAGEALCGYLDSLKVTVSFQILDSVFCTQTVLQYLA
jgi:hypothetical protein